MKSIVSFSKRGINKKGLQYVKVLGVLALLGCLFFYIILIVEYTSER